MREFVSCAAIETGARPSSAKVYRPRRPAKTLLHQITRENLETYLADLDPGEDFSAQVPLYVEAAFREYLKCGLLCHGFARAYCAGCGHDFLVGWNRYTIPPLALTVVKEGTFALPAQPAAWWRLPLTWLMMFCLVFSSVNGFCRCRSGSGGI